MLGRATVAVWASTRGYRNLLLVLSLLACASESGSEAVDTGDATGEVVDRKPFDEMTFDEKKAYMESYIVPTLAELAQQTSTFSGLADIRCQKCHGPFYEERGYAMPSLPPLDPGVTAEAEAPFVQSDIIPWLANATDIALGDPDTQKGAGCNICHMYPGSEEAQQWYPNGWPDFYAARGEEPPSTDE